MSERYFLGLLVILSALGSLWVSVMPQAVLPQLWVAVLLALLGLLALVNIGSRHQASIFMPMYFVAAILFSLYVYLTRSAVGIILLSVALLSLVGLVIGFGIRPFKGKKVATSSVSTTAPRHSGIKPKISAKPRRKSSVKKSKKR